MNNAIKETFKKICQDRKLIEEFSQLEGDEIFDYLKSHSDSDFTEQDFEESIVEILETLYNENTTLYEELERVAGGKGISGKKGIATTLALLSLTGSMPFISNQLDLTPKASALFGVRRGDYKIQDPFDMDEVIEHIRTDRYYMPILQKRGAPVNSKNDFIRWWRMGGNDSNGKRWWHEEDSEIAEATVDQAGDIRSMQAALNAALAGQPSSVQFAARQFAEHAESILQRSAQKANNRQRGDAGSNNSNGSNIAGAHAPEASAADLIDKLKESGGSSNYLNSASANDELAAVDRLMLKYFESVAKYNGVSTKGLNNDLTDLIGSDLLSTKLNQNFGLFNVDEKLTGPFGIPMGSAGRRKLISPSDRLKDLVLMRGKEQRRFEREVFRAQMLKNAPTLITSAILFSRIGTVEKIKDLLIQSGLWLKSGVIKAYNRFVYNRLTLERDPVKLKELMTEYLKSSVFRQDTPMEKVAEIMSGMADLWKTSDDSGKPCNCACTMTFMGDSGVGKTYAARTLSKAIFHKDMQPWQFVTSTSVTAASVSTNNKTQEQLSPADQLFNENSELVRQLKLNNRVVIVLDEIDKMHKADPNDTILERLRDARDTGKLLVKNGVNYEYIDVSRTVFICITNELRECWGLPKQKLTEAQAAARTTINRDKSLVNRFDIIEFNYLKADDYAYILKPQLDELKKEYAEKYGMNIEISEQLVKDISQAAEIKNKGVRGVNDFLVLIRGKLVEYRSKHKKELERNIAKKESKKINLSYIAEKQSFNLY